MTDDTLQQIELTRRKADAFFVLDNKVHITYKNSQHWKNGVIIKVNHDHLILDEVKEGKVPVFFQEVKEIIKFKEDNSK